MTSRKDAPPIAKITVAAIVGLNVLVFGALAALGVPLLHLSVSDDGSSADEATYIPLANTEQVPAEQVVRSVLAADIPGVKSAGPVSPSTGSAFDKACPDRKDPTPAVSYARPFRSGGRTVSVRVAAYGAGQGAAALSATVKRVGSCSGAGTYGTTVGPSSTAVALWSQSASTDASVLMWNRGDVIASVTVPRSGSSGLAAVAQAVDEELLTALDGTCASDTVSVADAGRSPWSVRTFTGNLEPQPVVLTYPTPSASPTAVVPSGVPLVQVPAPTLIPPVIATLPPDAPLPTGNAPTPPVATPAGTTGPGVPILAAPAVPVAPSSPPASVDVDEQVADPTGPGCGWAFTMQGAPNFDSAAAEAAYQAGTAAAQQQLQDADATWQQEHANYSIAYATYLAQVTAFADYARAQNRYVASALSAKYVQLLAEYEVALAARQNFDEQQASARSFYDLAVAECATAGSPTATASPEATPFPTETTTPTPEATETAATCPPEYPAILSEIRPTVPPSPKPSR